MLNRNYIKEVTKEEELGIIKELAYKIWPVAYGEILEQEQIEYMLLTIYSLDALKSQFNNKSTNFLILYENEIPEGFSGYTFKSDKILRIDKLYVNVEKHGRGYGKLLLEKISEIARQKQQIRMLELNVNRYNPAKSFYERAGFQIVEEIDIPIGSYWMNDYIMRKAL